MDGLNAGLGLVHYLNGSVIQISSIRFPNVLYMLHHLLNKPSVKIVNAVPFVIAASADPVVGDVGSAFVVV